ncbi:MAG: superoxide dismutase, partial [Armatimonadetes bacterium]|nr:superoxide dismutase [Armatimonadota bacterium]
MSESVDLPRREFLRRVVGTAMVGGAAIAGCSNQAELVANKSAAGRAGSPPPGGQPSPPGAAAVASPGVAPAVAGVGEHKLLQLPYPYGALALADPQGTGVKGISRQVVEWHHDKHHAGYVTALNAIERDIAGLPTIEAKANYSTFTELKRRETFNASGMYLHDIYWLNLTPGGYACDQSMGIYKRIVQDFGTWERWQEEFIGTGQTPNTGWAVLAIAPYDLKLHCFACSFHDLGGVWGSIPLIALDVWEHAYYYDYGPDRVKYINSFLRLLDWKSIDADYQRWS